MERYQRAAIITQSLPTFHSMDLRRPEQRPRASVDCWNPWDHQGRPRSDPWDHQGRPRSESFALLTVIIAPSMPPQISSALELPCATAGQNQLCEGWWVPDAGQCFLRKANGRRRWRWASQTTSLCHGQADESAAKPPDILEHGIVVAVDPRRAWLHFR